VVLPLLQEAVVPPSWVTNDQFIAGYGAAQAVPGPLFTFAAYLGTTMGLFSQGWMGGLLVLAAIFLPGFLLTVGALPFWHRLRRLAGFRRALAGVNAGVVGILLAALYDPVWTVAVKAPQDVALGLGAFALLAFWKFPPWLVVVLAAAGGAALPAVLN
jgi:chromate transporter